MTQPVLGRSSTDRIDRQSYEPAYAQLVSILRQQIATGVFHPGDQLPSEGQLCEQYDVSPMTVRRAINILLDQGLVSTVQGRGTFVRPLDLRQAVFNLQDLQSHLEGPDRATVKLLEARVVRADEAVATRLRLGAGERSLYIRRLLLAAGQPVIYHWEYLVYDPKRPIVEAELEATALQGLLTGDVSAEFRSGHLTIEAITLSAEEAGLLEVPAGSPAFRLEHVFRDLEDRPLSWGCFLCRADRFKFTADIGARAEVHRLSSPARRNR